MDSSAWSDRHVEKDRIIVEAVRPICRLLFALKLKGNDAVCQGINYLFGLVVFYNISLIHAQDTKVHTHILVDFFFDNGIIALLERTLLRNFHRSRLFLCISLFLGLTAPFSVLSIALHCIFVNKIVYNFIDKNTINLINKKEPLASGSFFPSVSPGACPCLLRG